MIGGSHSDLELKLLAKEAVAKHLCISAEPIVIESFTAKRAIPQYPVGFPQILEQIQEAKKEFPNLSLLGTSFHGVSINQCIASAKQFSFQKS
jgi:oxygen-dependent protoporphyrinogen oxidase